MKIILKVTYGCIVYQEQVMQIFRKLAGYSLGRADIVRRAMSKKKHDVMEKEREIFINGLVNEKGEVEVEGCIRRGVDKATANSIYNEMESFASYAFNKSHAASYATVSYQTAYLKCYYPKYYMASLLTSVLDNQNKLSVYIEECEHIGIKVLPPSVNYSYSGFTPVDNNIRFGLLAIKNLGRNFIDEIIEERKNGKFTSFYDFCKRLYGKNMNSRGIESLIKSGALDNLGANRKQMLSVYKNILENLEYDHRKNVEGQLSFFDMGDSKEENTKTVNMPDVSEFPFSELLAMEKEIAGMYLSGHPLSQYDNYAKLIRADRVGDVINKDNMRYRDGQQIKLFVIIDKVKNKITKSNQMMSFLNVEDKYGMMEAIIFPKTLADYGNYIFESNIVEMIGTVNKRENEDPKVIVNQIRPAPPKDNIPTELPSRREKKLSPITRIDNKRIVKPDKLYLRITSRNSKKFKKVKNILEIFSGSTMVIFYVTDENKQYKAPRALWADVNDVLIDELYYILGKENVVIK
ncbi:MAG: OB-fold nucleic acid binding domain-containing protein [Ruminococcus sp.]